MRVSASLRPVVADFEPTDAGEAFVDAPDAAGATGKQTPELPIGAILRRVQKLSQGQVERILHFQHEHGVRFGEAAIALELVSRDNVLWALSQQFHYPYAASAGALSDELVVARQPFGEQAEAFRELRSQLLSGIWARHEPRRALAVLSANTGDGKSYFAANMAIALSQLGSRTLLVDADMRTPRQHLLFGTVMYGGLSGILSGRAGLDAIRQVPDVPSLHVLPVGTLPPNPLDLIQRRDFELLLAQLVSQYDHVLVDTPAASHGADGRVAAATCGAALVIGRRQVSAIKPMQTLLRSLSSNAIKVAGVLINEHSGATPKALEKKRRWWRR
jgi:protein-tyrosine kinase